MAELLLEAEETGLDPSEGLIPQELENSDDAKLAEPPMEEPAQTSSTESVLLRERYLIYVRQPLPELNTPSAKAFIAEDRLQPERALYALICTPGLPVRLNGIKHIKNGDATNLLPLIDWDTVYWPALDQKTVIIVYARPLGGKLIDRMARNEIKFTEYDLPNRLISPLTQAIQSLAYHNLSYRAMRPENILFLDNEMEQIVLGPNVTAPAGYDQPSMFEPIDRAMALPAGRGTGDSLDDIYALGVNIILILLGYNPVQKMKDEELLEARLITGSYTAICGSEKLPMRLIEPLRGMLADDPNERWDFGEINNWLTGQKFNPVKRKPQRKSNTYFRFLGKDYSSPRILAWYFSKNPKDAAKAIKSDEFLNWLERGLKQPEKISTVTGAIQNAKFYADSYQGTDDYLTSRITAILDPSSPIRYKGLAFMQDGYGPMLASEWIRNNNPKPAADVLSHSITAFWQDVEKEQSEENIETTDEFSKPRGLLAIQDPGYGLERVLYETNPGLICQSPYVIKEGVMLIEQLLPALDKAANEIETSGQPIDRHIAGFIAARFSEDIHPHLKAIASPKPDTSIIGILSLLALLQWKLKVPATLALSSWVGGLLGPAINAYHNRKTRIELERIIPRLVRKGSLPELFNLIDDADKRQSDANGFAAGCAGWLNAESEICDIEGGGEERLTKAERSGQQIAAIISISIALIAIAVLVATELA